MSFESTEQTENCLVHPLRMIVAKRVLFGQKKVYTIRPGLPNPWYFKRTKWFEVLLSCQHLVQVPFGRRPKVGKRMRCPECLVGELA